MHTAKVFRTGHSQAVRLPKEFHISAKEVAISRLGDAIILQPIKRSWLDIYHAMHESKDFIKKRKDLPPQKREAL